MLLFHTDNLIHYGLDRIFQFAKEAGYDGIEVGIDLVLDKQNPEYLKELEKRYDIKIKAFSLSEKYENKLADRFQKTVRAFPGSIINLNSSEILSFRYKRWLLTTVPKLVKKYNLQYNHKNTAVKMFLGFIPQRSNNSIEVLKTKGDICLDLSALALSHEEIIRTIATMDGQLKHIYLSNFSNHQAYSLPTSGILPLESLLVKLAHQEFKGHFTVKVNPKFLSEGDEDILLVKMIRTREFYEKYFSKELGNIKKK